MIDFLFIESEKQIQQAQRRAATETVARKLIDPLYIHWVHI